MGDRTDVFLTVLTEHAKETLKVCGDIPETMWENDTTTCYYFTECNYGNLDCEEQLKERGIPYDKEWGEGGDYSSGTEYFRFTEEGEAVLKELYDNCLNPPLEKLLLVINEPEKLKEYILAFEAQVSVLPWDNQFKYSRIYLARQLVS